MALFLPPRRHFCASFWPFSPESPQTNSQPRLLSSPISRQLPACWCNKVSPERLPKQQYSSALHGFPSEMSLRVISVRLAPYWCLYSDKFSFKSHLKSINAIYPWRFVIIIMLSFLLLLLPPPQIPTCALLHTSPLLCSPFLLTHCSSRDGYEGIQVVFLSKELASRSPLVEFSASLRSLKGGRIF